MRQLALFLADLEMNMKFSKLAMAAATSVASLASAQLIPFDITGSGGDSFDYPFSATGVPNTITVDSFFVNGGAGTQAGDLQLILTSPSGTCLELGGRDLGFGCPDGGDFPGSWNSTAPDQYQGTRWYQGDQRPRLHPLLM